MFEVKIFTILMLDVNNVNFNTLPTIEKIEEFDNSMKLSQLRTTIEKNRKKVKNVFKTNVCEKRAPP
jgi:hypothetical protein